MAEEVDQLGGMGGAGIEPKVEVPPGYPSPADSTFQLK